MAVIVGVDIFFVISGYVITLLILKERSQETFRIGDFYYRRIIRIIPPLLLVSIFIYVCSEFLFYEPTDYEFTRESFYFQAFFAQNFFFASQSAEYFQGLTAAKLSLHLWSIAVEEQFYILYPFLFLLIYKSKNQRLLTIIMLFVLMASLALVAQISKISPLLPNC